MFGWYVDLDRLLLKYARQTTFKNISLPCESEIMSVISPPLVEVAL